MKSLSENLYFKSPIFIQNIGLSIYGWRLNRERYGGRYPAFFDEVARRSKCAREEIDDHVDALVSQTVRHATEDVPYYRRLFRRLGLAAQDIQSASDLHQLPLLGKSSIRRDPTQFVSDRYDLRKLQRIHTTGTTGTPLVIYCNETTRQANYAFYDHFLGENDIRYRGKRATFGGRIIVPPGQTAPPFWRYSRFQKNLLFSSYHLMEKNIPRYIDKLHTFQPDLIDAYPSSLYSIADFARRHDIELKGVASAITTSAETLFSEQLKVIEETFGVPVYDQYGAAEMCVFVGQCQKGAYHIRTDYALVEVLGPDGSPAPPGESGELVCTGFINPVMPLIRYRIGDRGGLSKNACPCGSPFPVLENLIGRQDDVLLTPDGRRVGRLSPVLKGFPVREVQYVQDSIEEVKVFIVRDAGYSEETDKEVISELRKRLGSHIALHLKFVEAIHRGPGGKFKSILSRLENES